jgi:hypothetical protein
MIDRERCLACLAFVLLGSLAAARGEGPVALRAPVYAELPLGAIKPAGWLKGQLELQAKGLGGHLDEFWPDIKDSAWIGGKAEGWERTPYWLDGAIPLAFLLDDRALKAKVKKYVDYILDHQTADGWLGPIGDSQKHKPYDVWPLFPLFKAFMQYEQATGDPRIVPAMQRACKKNDEITSKEPLYSWAQFRGADFIVSLYWLHEKTGDQGVLALASKISKQSYDWRAHFQDFDRFREKSTSFGLESHGVNTGMGLKFAGVRYRQSGDSGDRDAIFSILETLDRYHGQATGIFTCDEHLAGRSPSQGTELCTVDEAMYSLELLEGITGDARLGDRLEKLAFNAFPATFKKDMTAHQYDQQANQVVCEVSEPRVYTDNGPDSNLYGLAPNFGCCTANMHQGWPKLTTHLWAKSSDGGLAALVLAPCVVQTQIAGKPVKVEVETDYPFSDRVTIKLTVAEAMSMPLRIRVPAWAKEARVFEDRPRSAAPGTFFEAGQSWTAGAHVISLRLPMPVTLYSGYDEAVAIQRGPLVYALKIGTAWKKLRGEEPFADYEVHPTTPWNYALQIDRAHPDRSISFAIRPVGDRPFSQEGAPIVATVRGRKLPRWRMEKNAAAPPPRSPATSFEPLEDLTLIPYGCTDLRVTEFPTLTPDDERVRN